VGQRRDRRLRRSRQLRVGIVIAAAVAVLAGGVTVLATTLTDGEAAAGTAAAGPARIDRTERAVRAERADSPRPAAAKRAAIRAHTATKTQITKLPPPRPSRFPAIPANSGAGRRVVYCNSCQRVWLVEESGATFASYTVSGRRNYPRSGTYHVFRRINPGWSKTLRLPYFVGFTYGNTTDVGFHGIPLEPDGSPIQSESQLGTPRSHGCVRQSQWSARLMWDWATMGTTVVVIP
jgi:lipoprotein-anchoring transpeptidase ErfK/SrfK